MSKIKMLKEIKEEAESLATSIGNFLLSLEDETKDEKEITLEEVRKILADKSRLGHTKQIRELLIKYGANKLSEIDPSKYSSLLEDVGELR